MLAVGATGTTKGQRSLSKVHLRPPWMVEAALQHRQDPRSVRYAAHRTDVSTEGGQLLWLPPQAAPCRA